MTIVPARFSAAAWTISGAVALFAAWEGFVRWQDVRPMKLLPPSKMASAFADTPTFYLENMWVTARHLFLGVGASLVVSVAIGALLAAFRPLEHASQPLLVLILVTPWVAYITSIVLWLGSGGPSIVFLVAFVTVPGWVYATVAGMRGADAAARELFRSIDAPRREVLFKLRLPSALPTIFTAARINLGLGLGAAYFAEGAAFTTDGLGAWGKRAAAQQLSEILWTTILCSALLGVAAQLFVIGLERWLLRWHVSQRP
ncbi:MAG TPA: ABC transporter permease subunit [Ilumatobacter sp.]|nr:ABC transporter permease subunit [Ilumatobacter sp.]